MEQLNDNNFLIWKGAFNNVPAELEAVDDTIFMNINEDFATLYPLSNDTSNYGIDYSSFRLTYNDNPSKPARFNHGSGLLKYFPRLPIANGQVRLVKYLWNDIKGNESNEGIVSINITDRPLGWRVVPESGFCVVNANMQNTGYVGYSQLERYFQDDDTAVSPPQIKNNITSDPDYIAPTLNEDICPVGAIGTTVQFISELPFVSGGGENYATFAQSQKFRNPDTGAIVIDLFANSSLSYESFEVTAGTYNIEFRIAKGSSASLVKMKIVKPDDTIIADIDITTSPVYTYTVNNVTIGSLGLRFIIYQGTI